MNVNTHKNPIQTKTKGRETQILHFKAVKPIPLGREAFYEWVDRFISKCSLQSRDLIGLHWESPLVEAVINEADGGPGAVSSELQAARRLPPSRLVPLVPV